jgi:hypothetical protein
MSDLIDPEGRSGRDALSAVTNPVFVCLHQPIGARELTARAKIPCPLLRSVNKHRMRNVKISDALECIAGAAQRGFA